MEFLKDSKIPPSAYSDELNISTESVSFPEIIKIGTFTDPDLKDLPVLLPIEDMAGFSFVASNKSANEKAHLLIQKIALRLLCSVPPKLAKCYIIDPVNNGGSFSALLGLDNKLLNPEIWHDEQQISQGVNVLREQVPQIFSRLLQNTYKNLAEYNSKVSHSSQGFQFVLIAGFPESFNSTSAQKILQLMQNGHKAGIHVFMSIDTQLRFPSGIELDQFMRAGACINLDSEKISNVPDFDIIFKVVKGIQFDTDLPTTISKLKIALNTAIEDEISIIETTIERSLEWTKNSSKGVKIPIGLSENNQPIDFIVGHEANVHHALIGGSTGYGKSVLLHNIIINGSLLYSPEELQFVLLDFKQGTEFENYQNLPGVKILSIAGELEYGLSALEFLRDEIVRRGELFKENKVANINDYRKATGSIMPRLLVIIDEFQYLLSENMIGTQMLEDISRRGRSFGINLVLATQSLGDVQISSSTLSQIGLRIGFKMPEMDSSRILHSENDVAARFNIPGQAVYNTQNGYKAGNVLFQAAKIDKSQVAEKVNYLADKAKNHKLASFKKFIYNGETEINIYDNPVITNASATNSWSINDRFCDVYIGEPTYLQDSHAFLRLRKQAGSNLLICGDDPLTAINTTYYSLWQILKQSSQESELFIFDLFDIDSGLQGKFSELALSDSRVKLYTKDKPLETVLDKLIDELDQRFENENLPGRKIIAILNAQRCRELRKGPYDQSSLATKLARIIKDGPDYGIHGLLYLQKYKNFDELFNYNLKNEFENLMLLKGEDPLSSLQVSKKIIYQTNMAYFKTPFSRYEIDKIKTYKKS